jgi:hypothetical protein
MSENARSSAVPPHGSLAEEAVKLAEVAQLWLRDRTGRATDDTDDPWAEATAPDAADEPAECRTCPVCRAKRFVRDVNPEVLEHLSDAAASLASAVAAMSAKDRPADPR